VTQKGISVIVPVYNEEKTIKKVLDELVNIKEVNEIIVIDDNSIDKTIEIIKRLKSSKIILIQNKSNLGKGATIRQAFPHLLSKFSVIQDADLELNTKYIVKYLNMAIEKDLEVVFGSRFKSFRVEGYPISLSFANKVYTGLINLLTGSTYSDVNCGHKFFKTDVLINLDFKENHFGADPEMAYIVANKKYSFSQYNIDFKARNKSEGKKITWLDGIKFFKIIYRVHRRLK
jgi:glycosyltransferase involved in cell wall biosynthesis